MSSFQLRFAASLLSLSALATSGALAHAQTKPPAPKGDGAHTIDQCIAAAEEGQTLRDSTKLRDARARFVTCAASACPAVVSKECNAWLSDVESRLPTVVFSAVDGAGNDLVDVKVSVDGQPLLTHLTGTQTPLDPGPHHFRFETAGAPPVEETWVIAERQKGRTLQAKFPAAGSSQGAKTEPPPPTMSEPPAPAEPPAKSSSSPPVAAYVAGGIGAVALASFAVFGIWGVVDHGNLNSDCGDKAPPLKVDTCTKDQTDSLKTKLLVADISLGVGLVAAGVATYLFLTHPKEHATQAAIQGHPILDHALVSPVRNGGWVAGYETSF